MDIKSDDIFIDIDPAILLSYEIDKLNLDSIPNDIFEFSEEIPKSEDNLDDKSDVLSETKIAEPSNSKDKCILKSHPTENKSSKLKLEAPSRREKIIQKRKTDINGNEEPSSDENLHDLLESLVLSEDLTVSDSDNEANEDSSQSKLIERTPVRPRRRASRNRDSNILNRNERYDRTQFNEERLRYWSGSTQVQLNETYNADQFTVCNDSTSTFSRNETISALFSQDCLYEDARANAVSSPESGYDSSSAQSITSSPPRTPFPTPVSLDFIPETVDEQYILDILAENTTENTCALTNKDDILNFLKDTPVELNESSNAAAASPESIQEYVPLVSHAEDLGIKSVSLSANAVSKTFEAPKKLVFKLEDKAKRTLRKFLCNDEFHAAAKKIYKKTSEDEKNNEPVKVIYVEDETDKNSENRTNLHYAVLNSKVEDIFSLVEIHKQFNLPFSDINIRDKYGKTALDYAVQNQMTLVVDYLKENTACQNVII